MANERDPKFQAFQGKCRTEQAQLCSADEYDLPQWVVTLVVQNLEECTDCWQAGNHLECHYSQDLVCSWCGSVYVVPWQLCSPVGEERAREGAPLASSPTR